MSPTKSAERIQATGHRRFIALLLLSTVAFAFGFSILLFGLTTNYLISFADRVGVVGVGTLLLVGGAASAYRTLT